MESAEFSGGEERRRGSMCAAGVRILFVPAYERPPACPTAVSVLPHCLSAPEREDSMHAQPSGRGGPAGNTIGGLQR